MNIKIDTIMRSQEATRPYFYRVQASEGWYKLGLKSVWQYRDLLWFLTTRDLMARYRQMALGPLWIILQPLLNMVIFSVIFGGLAKLPSDSLPYPLFTYAALIPWDYFSGAATASSRSLVGRMAIISKVYFPRLIIPISAVINGLIDMAISFVILLGMMIFFGYWPKITILILPLFILFASAFALGIGLWSATLAVRYRDLSTAISYAIRVGMYATPVAYSASLIPQKWLFLYKLNPMYWVVEGFRWTLLGSGAAPEPIMLIPIALVIVLLISGAFVFRNTELTIVDWL